ncbi:MAG TPA: biofilm formation protein PelB, partial [Thiopseudomonas sp.]|nr:biofilm formation protein PelB [Thiopseudomonas sp.]
ALLNQPEQEQQKTFWLHWAKQKSLIVSDFEQIEEALRSFNFSEIQRLLISQRMPKEQQVAALKALNYRHSSAALALSELSDEYAAASRQQFRNHALEELKVYPQGAQLAFQQRDFGGVTYSGITLAVARVLDDHWYARLDADSGTIKVTESKKIDFAKEDYVRLALNRQLHNGSLDLSVNHSNSDIQSRTGAAIARHWQITQKSSLSLGYNWKDRTDSSGLMYAVGQKSGLWLRGYQQITARDSFSWGIEKSQYSTRYNEKIGTGQSFELQAAHTVFFQNPTWLVRAGFDYQKNNLNEKTLTKLPNYPVDNEPLNTSSLLVEKYKYAYIGTSLQRGTPGALNRTVPQYSWMIDAVVGHQWPDKKITYAVTAGIGTEVFGDDELALNVGYQSAPKSQFENKPGGTLGVSYSLRFGR